MSDEGCRSRPRMSLASLVGLGHVVQPRIVGALEAGEARAAGRPCRDVGCAARTNDAVGTADEYVAELDMRASIASKGLGFAAKVREEPGRSCSEL